MSNYVNCSNHSISFRNWAKVDINQGTHWHELVPVKPRGVNSMSIIGSFNSNWGLRCNGHFWWFKLLSNGVIVLFLVCLLVGRSPGWSLIGQCLPRLGARDHESKVRWEGTGLRLIHFVQWSLTDLTLTWLMFILWSDLRFFSWFSHCSSRGRSTPRTKVLKDWCQLSLRVSSCFSCQGETWTFQLRSDVGPRGGDLPGSIENPIRRWLELEILTVFPARS